MRPEYIFMDLDGTISDPKEGTQRRWHMHFRIMESRLKI